MLTKWDYQQALQSQNACNLSGIVRALADVTNRIWDEVRANGGGTDDVNRHPICRLLLCRLTTKLLVQRRDKLRCYLTGIIDVDTQTFDAGLQVIEVRAQLDLHLSYRTPSGELILDGFFQRVEGVVGHLLQYSFRFEFAHRAGREVQVEFHIVLD